MNRRAAMTFLLGILAGLAGAIRGLVDRAATADDWPPGDDRAAFDHHECLLIDLKLDERRLWDPETCVTPRGPRRGRAGMEPPDPPLGTGGIDALGVAPDNIVLWRNTMALTVIFRYVCDECGETRVEIESELHNGYRVTPDGLPRGWSMVNDRMICPLHDIQVKPIQGVTKGSKPPE